MSEKQPAKDWQHLLPSGYRKRSVYVEKDKPREVNVASYWSGGSRDDFTLVRNGCARNVSVSINPMVHEEHHRHKIQLQPGDYLIRSGICCGKEAVARITVVEAV